MGLKESNQTNKQTNQGWSVPWSQIPQPDHMVIKLFPAQLRMKNIMLINVQMPTIVVILTFISRMRTPYEHFKQENSLFFQYFCFS